MMNFDKLLEDGFIASQDVCATRMEYLSDMIFDFMTYDSEKAEEFVIRAVEVCEAISGRKTFDYIKDPEQYRWYLLMVNMPFFVDRLTWGTSIRGAWWDYKAMEYNGCGLWNGVFQIQETLTLEPPEWLAFIDSIIKFAKSGRD